MTHSTIPLIPESVKELIDKIETIPDCEAYGRVVAIRRMLVEEAGATRGLSAGDRCDVQARGARSVICAVIGFRAGHALVMPFQPLEAIGLGWRAVVVPAKSAIRPTNGGLGRMVNAMGQKKGPEGPNMLALKALAFRSRSIVVAPPVTVFLNTGCAKSAHAVIVDELLPRMKFLFGQRVSVTRILE